MLLDSSGVDALAQQAANYSNVAQDIFQRKDGSYIYCTKGMSSEVKKYLPANEQLRYLKTIIPSTWPKDDTL